MTLGHVNVNSNNLIKQEISRPIAYESTVLWRIISHLVLTIFIQFFQESIDSIYNSKRRPNA